MDFLVQGLGSPAFDKLEALLAGALLSLPTTMGFEFGSGFAGTEIHEADSDINFLDECKERMNYLYVATTLGKDLPVFVLICEQPFQVHV